MSLLTEVPEAVVPQRLVLTESVYETVKQLIMDLRLEPGARINMGRLASNLGVSNTPLREVLVRLESEGLVTRRSLQGYRVAPLPDESELDELFDIRLLLEPEVTLRAAERVSAEQVKLLEATIEEARTLAEPEQAGEQYRRYQALVTADAAFHDVIAAASGNKLLRRTLAGLHGHVQLYRVYFKAGEAPKGPETAEEHRAIIAGIVAGDPPRAENAMRDHLVLSRQRVLATCGLAF